MEAANTSSPRWLACADSVAALRLHVPSMFLRLGRAVLDLVSCMGALESLQISGGCYSSDLARMAPRRRLRRSSLSRVNARLLEELLAACPLLEELHVRCLDGLSRARLTVSSASLKRFTLMGRWLDGILSSYGIFLDTPHLQGWQLHLPQFPIGEPRSPDDVRSLQTQQEI
ncbi:uncharacterized protein LOC9649305 [Selaginella moellendorffii]|uniref:uncharacterized protein LOC9649305 n=1 Tax=Selaginella moellendorffii TaxID=88036 RepID=UPI000D1C79D9|nr:uncharacterized protein LOC9649305 [Selaginella moellendorffii]|eukprot:XP_024514936.1 uncharacterized protein LOC9649305 [Selaginella moellendorffii]